MTYLEFTNNLVAVSNEMSKCCFLEKKRLIYMGQTVLGTAGMILTANNHVTQKFRLVQICDDSTNEKTAVVCLKSKSSQNIPAENLLP